MPLSGYLLVLFGGTLLATSGSTATYSGAVTPPEEALAPVPQTCGTAHTTDLLICWASYT
mgnify:CR=1 FL=1